VDDGSAFSLRRIRAYSHSFENDYLSWLLEFDVEVPASAEGTHGRFLPVAFPADHAHFGAIRALGERAGMLEKWMSSPSSEENPGLPDAYVRQ